MTKTSNNFKKLSLLVSLSIATISNIAYGEDKLSDSDRQTESFVYKSQNPLSPTYSLPLKYTMHGGAERGEVSIGSLQPIIPVSLGNWNMINQLSLNFIGTPGVVKGIAELPEPFQGNGVAGLGDTNLTSLFTAPISDDYMLGIGPTFVFPSDLILKDMEDRRSRELGSGKFSVGPALTFVTQPKPWTLGINIKQIWSVIGSQSRHGVSQMVLQPFANYNLSDGWYLVSDMDMIANWNHDANHRWTVPVGGGVGKVFPIGKHALNTRMEGYYNAIRPDQTQSPEWSANFTLQFLY